MMRVSSITLVLSALMVFLFSGCDKYIYEDLEECPQGVYISFYHQTPCMDEPTAVGEVDGLHVFAFDLHDKLVKIERIEGLVDIVEAYKVELPPVEKGQYSFIAWAGTSDQFFTLNQFVVGETTKEDVLMTLRSKDSNAVGLGSHQVWQGESKAISLPDRKEYGTVYEEVAINMLEVTNRIQVTLKLHESVCETLDIDDFEIMISSANGTSLINKRMPLGAAQLTYPGTEIARDDTSVRLAYTLMELKSGYSNVLKVYNKKEDKNYFVQDLLGKVLLENPNVNLECTHDFDIVMEIEDKCKDCPDNHLVVHIMINNYTIHSFSVDLSNRY
ncbi:Minor fimbrium anchoring subunit Mfa2 [Porphyromonas levii]|uniref:FimB/Mfa2 family fimbrial subunit n=1 Tax=Porphyromonas levii TaxID=28114 RepID=UPI001BAD5EFC|nr:FimB/Mfa2 family fimbrial subunit [Porphyromonas levii]MBR8766227.1 Minor fimbrium anchoring subunit Mfa2 [Porphyromonas levii]